MTDHDASRREALRLEEAHGADDPYAAAIRATRMPIVISDARLDDNPIVFANDAFLTMAGYGRDEVIGRNCRFLQGPETSREDVARVAAAIAAGASVAIELLNYRKDGSTFWNALQISPVFDPAGEITHFFGSQLDVTDRNRSADALRDANVELSRAKDSAEALVKARTEEVQAALDQKTALLHEMDHRVKNNLQLIASLIQLQARRVLDVEARGAMQSMLGRVSALATVHRNLFQADDLAAFEVSAFVRDIAKDLVDATGRDDVRLEFDLTEVVIPASRAAPVALIVNELVTNALKHGFPDRGGRIALAVMRRDDDFVIEIGDDGVGDGHPGAETPGFGLSLVELLSKQLSAGIDRESAGQGVKLRITVPDGRPPIDRKN